MSGIEKTLLQTLSKGDARDVEFRKRVYNAAANALKRSLEAQGAVTADAAQAQKDRLANAIRSVEARFQTSANAVPPASAPGKSRPFPRHATHARAQEVQSAPLTPQPSFTEPAGASVPTPELRVEVRDSAKHGANDPQPDRKSTQFRLKRGKFAAGFGVVALVGVLILGLLWVMLSGAFQDPEARDTSVPNPPADTGSEDFQPRDPGTSTAPALRADAEAANDWVTVFTSSDLQSLTLTGGTTAEAASDPFGDYVRIITPPAGTAAVDLPLGPLQDLAGQRAQVEVTAKTADGQTTQMAVTCDLGGQVECVRTRFGVGQAGEAFIYRIDLTNVGSISQPGRLILQSDVVGSGKEIKLISVRLRAQTEG